MYCAHKGTSNNMVFRSSLILNAFLHDGALHPECITDESAIGQPNKRQNNRQ